MNKQRSKHDGIGIEYFRILESVSNIMKNLKSIESSKPKRRITQSSKSLDLKIDLENFGPVVKGTIRLKPLTILVGPNNSGKSYASVLIHSILSTSTLSPSMLKNTLTEDLDVQLQQMKKRTSQISVRPTTVKRIRDTYVKEFGTSIGKKLSYNFKSEPVDMIRNGSKSTKISISGNNTIDIIIKKGEITSKLKTPNTKVTIKSSDNPHLPIIQESASGIVVNMTPDMKKITPYILYEHLERATLPFSLKSYYLPATRSGIIQTYKILAANLMSTNDEKMDTFPTHTIPGTITDLASNLLTIPNQKGSFANVAKLMEDDLLEGSINLPQSRDKFPEITYVPKGNSLPLHLASSTVSEIAPISMYLKYLVSNGDLLIIEEPESHMHPANQSRMAKNIVRMIRAGLNVLITTHSPYIVERLGQFVMAGMLDEKTRTKRAEYKTEYLLPDEVSPYVFKQSRGGYHIHEIEKNQDVGIDQEEFTSILNELGNKAAMLDPLYEK